MADLNFPSSPVDGQQYNLNGVYYTYNSTMGAWLTSYLAKSLDANVSNTQIYFNDAGTSNGSPGLVFLKGSNTFYTANASFSGNVGIGTATPTYKLDVNGTVNASALLVNGVAVGGGSMDYAYVNTSTTAANNYMGSLANTGFATQTMTVTSLSDSSGTIAWDASTSRMATVTLSGTGRTVSNPTNLRAGSYVLVIKQDATGSRTITTWGSVFKWPAAVVPTLSTTASTTDVFSFWCDGTNLYGTFIPDCR